MNSLIQTFVLNHFAPSAVVTSSYNEVRNNNEFAAQTETIINHLLNPTGDEATYDNRETATALYLIDVVEGYSSKRDKPAAKLARDCLRKRLNAHLKEHGLAVSFKLKTSEKPTRIEFAPVKTQCEEKAEAAAKEEAAVKKEAAEKAEAAAKKETKPTAQSSTEQLIKIQEEKSVDDQVKILVKLATELPADIFEQYLITLQLVQIERETKSKPDQKQTS